MAHPSQRTSISWRDRSRQQERAERILDAAAALILRWGYNKTTIDDIARQAGVAKGTIYLHWKTRDELFGALVKRERADLAENLRRRIVQDPTNATLGGILKHSALALLKRPLLKAVLLGDLDVLGKLARSHDGKAGTVRRLTDFNRYLEFLRDHDLMRTDRSPRAQASMLSAIFMGFFLIAPMMPDEFALSDEERAELIAETIHRTLEPDRSFSPDELQATSRVFLEYLDDAASRVQGQLELDIESESFQENLQ